jgi:hypothetical protein
MSCNRKRQRGLDIKYNQMVAVMKEQIERGELHWINIDYSKFGEKRQEIQEYMIKFYMLVNRKESSFFD